MTSLLHSSNLTEECRATSTSSSAGDEDTSECNFSVKNGSDELRLFDILKSLQTQMTVLTHRIESISKVFNVPNCECSTCGSLKINEKALVKPAELNVPTPLSPVAVKPSTNTVSESVNPPLLEQENPQISIDNMKPEMLEALVALHTQKVTENKDTSHEKAKRGRKSKYCDAETKVMIANYAKQFGPNAAARKFKIPPPIASYYYRKSVNSPKLPNIGSIESPNDVVEEPVMPLLQHANHVSGSPGFLRGRGRGRPKLIGDELDANLLDYMVDIKKSQNLTAGRAMDLAKEYIKKHSPGLLIEEGGSVNLKNTWAIKLLVRVAEREQELSSNSNEIFNPLTSLLGSFDGNAADFANIFNFVHQMSNSAEVPSNAKKSNNSDEENMDNVENEMSKPPALMDVECTPVVDDALKSFLASVMQNSS